jgi:hypothetical protein
LPRRESRSHPANLGLTDAYIGFIALTKLALTIYIKRRR